MLISKIPGVNINPIEFNKDSRGYLTELFRVDQTIPHIAMGYFSVTYPGISRGPHEHYYQSDCFYFLDGCIELRLWDNRVGTPLETLEVFYLGSQSPCRVIIPPRIVHGYRNVSLHPAMVLNFPDRLYKGYDRLSLIDEIRWEDGPDSPFTWPEWSGVPARNGQQLHSNTEGSYAG